LRSGYFFKNISARFRFGHRVVDQIRHETDRLGVGTLEALLKKGDTWTVPDHGAA
jgi:hypothetical protein